MNWDAVGVVSNIILVTALVVITAWYAKKVSKQTELMVQDRERNKILEEVQYFLTPTIHLLKEEIAAIEENKISWHRYTSGRSDFTKWPSKLIGSNSKKYSGAVRDSNGKFPELATLFASHDDHYDKLNDLYAKIENKVKTPALKERLTTLANKFNESRDATHRLSGESFEKPGLIFGEFIINSRYPIERSQDTIQPHIDFWENHRDELLVKFRNTPQIKKLDKEIEGLLRKLKELDEELLETLEKIMEEYRVEHKLTISEIDPNLRENEAWY